MHLGRDGLRHSSTQNRRSAAYRPVAELLEDKTLLATVQLGAGTTFNLASQTTTPPNGPQTIGGQLPFIADTLTFNSTTSNQTQGNQTTDPGLGILETGNIQTQGVGFNVAALGDMNGDGNNDFLIGAPTVTSSGNIITPSTGNNSQAFLLFGNRSATVPTIQSWLSSTPEERVGVINNVGGALQFNPFTDRGEPYNYNFDGITFITSQDPTSQLGAFVASAGPNAFVIGAPNYTGGGRLYYITATTNFNALSTPMVDLDSPQNYPGLTILTFEAPAGSASNLGLGTSIADIPNLFGDGVQDIALGEPGASVTPTSSTTTRTGNGAVFIYQVPSLPLTVGTANTITVSTTSAALTLAGANSGDGLGASIANAGSVDGNKLGAQPINDILIGAPTANSNTGAAYLVYGGSTLTSAASAKVVDLSRVNLVPTTPVQVPPPPVGAVFLGGATGDLAGFSVSSAGNFNGNSSGLSSFMIGSPGAGTLSGRVNLIYGAATNTTTGVRPISSQANGYNSFTLPSLPTNLGFSSVIFSGGNIGDRLGYSLSAVGATGTGTNPILIGAPGVNGGQGTVYELQGTSGKTFTTATTLGSSGNNTIARQYTLTFPLNSGGATPPIGFGSSVSSFYTGGDADFIAGAPGYTGTLATGGPTTPPFPLAGAAAVVLATLQPSGSLPLLGGTTPTPPPSGGVSGGTVFQVPALPGEFTPTTYISPLGTNFVPSVASLSTLSSYAPIPLKVAIQQYLPPDGFIQRIYAYAHPGKSLPPTLQNRGQVYSANYSTPRGVWTLGSHVFNRGRFHPGKTYKWTHTSTHNGTVQRVVPAQASRQKYTSQGNPLGKV